ncbi:MAG: hypothetical protein SH847_07060, partial [Roseiflexaceae bacterium]|nr:hypothetical protein [Roseiflexaceae bacterium]
MRAAPDRADRTTNELLPKTCPIFRDDRSIRYDARSSKLKSMDRVSLSTMHGRVVAQFVLSDR